MIVKNTTHGSGRKYSRRGSIGVFIAGGYQGTYAGPSGSPTATALGLTETGYKISQQFKYQEIADTDVYAESTLDVIFRGQRTEVGGVLNEVNSISFRMIFPWTGAVTPTGSTNLQLGVGGYLGSGLAGALVLTVVAGTPAATAAAPTTNTFPLVIPAPGFDFERTYNAKLRQTPFRLLCLPNVVGTGDVRFWQAT